MKGGFRTPKGEMGFKDPKKMDGGFKTPKW